jgi:acyl dehydratase
MYFEEFKIGQRFQCESFLVTEEEIHTFAMKYDPHPIHIDQEFAENNSMFHGIISSGFLTLSAMWGQWIRLGKFGNEFIVGKNFDYVKFTAPVRMNDILTTEVEIGGKKLSSKSGRGEITLKFTVTNQHDEVVLLTQINVLLKTRKTIQQEKVITR